jgi:p-aminobenzoyl-glutamate transporter AbgT
MRKDKKKNKRAQNSGSKRPFFLRMLDYVEIAGNKLPHPATLFAGLALLVVIISWIGLLVVWMLLGIPLGPDGPLYIP